MCIHWFFIFPSKQEFREKAAQYAQSKHEREVEDEDEDVESNRDEKSSEKEIPDEKSTTTNIAVEGKVSPESEIPKADEKSSPPKAESKTGEKSISSPMQIDPLLRPRQALPHHLPKMNSLSHKLDDIRKNLGDTVSYWNYMMIT